MTSSEKKDRDEGDGGSDHVTAPDGGWGWVVVIGAIVLNFLIGGAVNTFGVLYVALLDKFNQSAGATAWVGSMANAMGLMLGPLASALSTRFSCRKMVLVGGVLTSLGWATTGLMPRLEYMFLTYGLIAGIGKSMAYTPSIVMVGQWFDKRRSIANGLSVAGAGVGTFAFAPLLEYLLESYGFTGTMLIMGGVMLIICICGSLFRPVPVKKGKENTELKGEINHANTEVEREVGSEGKAVVEKSQVKSNSFLVNFKGDDLNHNPRTPFNSFEIISSYNSSPEIYRVLNGDVTRTGNGQCNDDSSFEKNIDRTKNQGNDISKSKDETKKLKDYLDYTLLCNSKFICFGISVMLATLGHSPASVMLPALAKQYHVASDKAAFLLSITGITDIIGRLIFGALCDIKGLRQNRVYLYVASIFISGIANITCGFATRYWHFATYSVIFGLFAGSYNALTPVILVDLLGASKLSSSFGLALLFQGIGFLLGPPMAGWIRDGFGEYQSAFYFAGVAMVLSSIVINISPLLQKYQISSSKRVALSGQVNKGFKRDLPDREEDYTVAVISVNKL